MIARIRNGANDWRRGKTCDGPERRAFYGGDEMDREKVIKGLECCMKWTGEPNTATCHCSDCSYTNMDILGQRCLIDLINDALALLKEQEEEHRRLLSWLGKFCRHIDNGDAWLTDEENIAFFKEKMKQQFGWDVTDDA